jgi:hypothetical protein
VYDCEILISDIERRPALYDCTLKEYSDKGLEEKLWGEVCEAVVSEWSQLEGPEKRKKLSSFVSNIFNTSAQVYINLL